MVILSILLASFVASAKQVSIDTAKSSIEWVGQKTVPGDDHTGTVKVKEGTIKLDDKMMVTGGTITIDMNSINNKDLTGEWKKKLEGHLKSEDFFAVEKFPEATFKITKVTPSGRNAYQITGNLTLRGKTDTETFNLTIAPQGKVITAEGKLSFDRNKYGITYNSETSVVKKIAKVAKDKVIKDKIELTVNLTTATL